MLHPGNFNLQFGFGSVGVKIEDIQYKINPVPDFYVGIFPPKDLSQVKKDAWVDDGIYNHNIYFSLVNNCSQLSHLARSDKGGLVGAGAVLDNVNNINTSIR